MKSRFISIALVLFWTLATHAATPPRDFTFFLFSDIHIGAENLKANPPVTREQTLAKLKTNLETMRRLVGQPCPQADIGTVALPRGLFILGDLTDGHKDPARQQEQWRTFEALFPVSGFPLGARAAPVFALAGNHDGPIAEFQRQGLLARNRVLAQGGKFSAISSNGVHYALNWDSVHFLFLTLCAADKPDAETPFKFGKPGPGGWNDPLDAFTFLKDYLTRQVGTSGAPVVILQHYGFDNFSLNDWNWWTPKQRRALYELIKDYNVVAFMHGHDHHTAHYRWPDPKQHAADLDYFFDGKPPANPRQYDVLSCGQICWVVRIRGNQFSAAHRSDRGWDRDSLVKSLAPRATP
ncbi:MAG: metallophosphoesterase [Kiritimatiellaeota bacterium]|nr:metallophosphoesterase [Kiritimatiellota bacterium]